MDNESRSFSSILLEALRTKGLSIEKLAQVTGISERFLALLFEEKTDKLPPLPYVHGYLIKVSDALGLDGKKLWEAYLKDNMMLRRSGKNDRLPGNRFMTFRFNTRILFGAALLILVIIVFVALRTLLQSRKPHLALLNLESMVVTSSSDFMVAGSVDPGNRLTLNNEEVYPDSAGNFEKEFRLQPGFNTLTFRVKRLLGSEYVVTRQIFYEEPADASSESAQDKQATTTSR